MNHKNYYLPVHAENKQQFSLIAESYQVEGMPLKLSKHQVKDQPLIKYMKHNSFKHYKRCTK